MSSSVTFLIEEEEEEWNNRDGGAVHKLEIASSIGSKEPISQNRGNLNSCDQTFSTARRTLFCAALLFVIYLYRTFSVVHAAPGGDGDPDGAKAIVK